MEYDRALYRVYERIMEDLQASPPIAVSRPTAPPLPTDQSAAQRRQRQIAAAGGSHDAPIPFLLPSSCVSALDVLLDALHTRQWEALLRSLANLRRPTGRHVRLSTADTDDVTPQETAEEWHPRLSRSTSRSPDATRTVSSDDGDTHDDEEDTGADLQESHTDTAAESARVAAAAARSQSSRNSTSDVGGGCTKRGLYILMRTATLLGFLFLYVTVALHLTYVGAGVVPTWFWFSGSGNTKTCLEYALETRGVDQRDRRYFDRYGDSITDDDQKNDPQKNATLENDKIDAENYDPPLLGVDELLQIKILYGSKCMGQCSRVRNVYLPESKDERNDDLSRSRWLEGEDSLTVGEQAKSEDIRNQGNSANGLHPENSSAPKHEINPYPGVIRDPLSSAEYWETPDYMFSTNEALLYLDNKITSLHNVSIVNVTLTDHCLATGSDKSKGTSFLTRSGKAFSRLFGTDTAIINQLMYGIKTSTGEYRNGYVQAVDTQELWSWNRRLLQSQHSNRPLKFLFFKAGTLFLSFLAFFLITSITALIVRVLTSSGVVMMFPLFAFFRSMGLRGADDRILGYSYPWIGQARAAIGRERIHAQSHLIWGHLAKMLLYYVMYEACQAAWSVVLYGKSVPEALPLWIYGFAMIWEYFSMVFVRSALGAYFFPRMTMLYFVMYHFYFYSVPYGYFDVALLPWFLFMVQTMLYTLLALEIPAASRISLECPREVFNRLSWPEWNASLPHEWTMFLPLNSRYVPLSDRDLLLTVSSSATAEQDALLDEDEEEEESSGARASNNPSASTDQHTLDIVLPIGSDDGNTTTATVAALPSNNGLYERRSPRHNNNAVASF